MAEEKVRLGIIGLGAEGGMYARFLDGDMVPDMRIGAICDTDEEKKKQADDYGVPFYTDYRAMIDSGDVDAVVAANDLIGIGVLHAADDLGLRVPEDLAITGMDDTELAQVTRPGLTSVDLGAAERGRVAAELLIARIAEPDRAAHAVTVAPALRIRGSSVERGVRAVAARNEEAAG